jgi:hypothetical protein
MIEEYKPLIRIASRHLSPAEINVILLASEAWLEETE